MSDQGCTRRWEAEAERDGRLTQDARAAYERHVQHCADCASERAELAQLGEALRASHAELRDDIVLRRVRQNVLSGANREVLKSEPAQVWGSGRVRAALLLLMAAGALTAVWLVRRATAPGPEPVALHLVAHSGARFEHERRGRLEYVVLNDGTLDIAFDRRLHAELLVRVPDGEVRDYGTKFRVTVREGRTDELAVREGAVVLRRYGLQDRIVRAGEVFKAEPIATTVTAIDAGRLGAPPTAAVDVGRPEAPASLPPSLNAAHKPPNNKSARPTPDQQDRAYLHILALVKEGRTAEARVAAQLYQREYPNGFRRSEVERIALSPAH
jgi:hypothetical protein